MEQLSSVNAKVGTVVLDTDDIGEGVNKYYTDAKVQTVIDTNTAGYASTTYVDTEDATTLSSANTYTDTSIAAISRVDLSSYETIVNSNAGDATTLSSANTYTDTSIAAIPATDLVLIQLQFKSLHYLYQHSQMMLVIQLQREL